ncbi:hypothetical protein RRG08_033537 [Elysia crispata]|uniref:Uncharacterized protein n=1 Tax=Elysia crispata TaxID=231223 RepID=A0AAE0XNR8_9GAST|nr:hypothetical protein RRG08_033537 [Elysia crispata]
MHRSRNYDSGYEGRISANKVSYVAVVEASGVSHRGNLSVCPHLPASSWPVQATSSLVTMWRNTSHSKVSRSLIVSRLTQPAVQSNIFLRTSLSNCSRLHTSFL